MTQDPFMHTTEIVKPGDTYSSLTTTSLKLTATNDAFKKGRRAHAAKKYCDAVNHYTDALEALKTEISSVIHVHRAAAYEMQSQYQLAAEDAKAANPYNEATSPDPYFALANALFLSGQVSKAEYVYQQGAENVPKTHPQQERFAVKHAQILALKENQNQRLIQALPHEVVFRILSRLSIKDRGRLATTCRFWNSYLLHQWPHMWHTINPTRIEYLFMHKKKAQKCLNYIRGDQVRDLNLEFMDLVSIGNEYMDIDDYYTHVERKRSRPLDPGTFLLRIINQKWNGVETLTTQNCITENFNTVSRHFKESLKTLTLTNSTYFNDYGLEIINNVVHTFPKIQTITNNLMPGFLDNELPYYIKNTRQYPNFRLTSLSLSYETDDVDEICQEAAPSLISLTIPVQKVKDYTVILNAVHQHCIHLESLNISPVKVEEGHWMTYTRSSPEHTSNGLKTLILRSPVANDNINVNESLGRLFKRAYKSLQTLDLNLDVLETGQCSALNTLSQCGAPQLQTLIITATNKCTVGFEPICKLIAVCPSLVTINITGANIWNDRILTELSKLRQLQNAHLNFGYGNTPAPKSEGGDDECATTKSLSHFLGNASNLHDFSFNYPSRAPAVLRTRHVSGLAKALSLSTVRTFDISNRALTSETLLECLILLKSSQIRTLKIRTKCPVRDRELDAFADIQHLTHLIIIDKDFHITKEQVCKLLTRWRNPQMLYIHIRRDTPMFYVKGHVDNIGMRQAKEHITNANSRYSIRFCAPEPLKPVKGTKQRPKAQNTFN